MSSVLEKQLARGLDVRLAVFAAKAADGSLLHDEMSLRAAAYMASEIILPCCCMLCNKAKLETLYHRRNYAQKMQSWLGGWRLLYTMIYHAVTG